MYKISSKINATFWDNFAIKLNEAVIQQIEKPIIISDEKVDLWNGT